MAGKHRTVDPPSPWEALHRADPSLFEPVRTRAAFEDVMRQIIDLVGTGQLVEGDVLPGERVLAAQMQVSRPTIRLAIGELAKAGIVEVKPGRTGGIRLVSQWIPGEFLGETVALRADETFALLEARRAVEPRVALLAAMRGTDDHFSAMQAALELQEQHAAERPKAMQAEFRFHRIMWQASGNQALEAMMRGLFGRMATIFDMAMRTQSDQATAVELHRATLSAIRRGRVDDVESVMDDHMGYLERMAEEAFGRQRIRPLPPFLLRRDPE
jgi:GntR family transcriptional repressor for pyruvate dehydrogenase complex